GQADLADHPVAAALGHREIAEAEHLPMAGIAQDARPDLFPGAGPAADEARHRLLTPQRAAGGMVGGAMPAQDQPLCLQPRDHYPAAMAARGISEKISALPLRMMTISSRRRPKRPCR